MTVPAPPAVDELMAQLAAVRAREFRALVDSSDDAIVSKSLDGIVASWNPAAERLFGYRADEMVGQSILRLFPPDRLGEEVELLAVIRRGGRVQHYETVRLHRNGHALAVAVTLSPILDERGQVVGASKIARDISQRLAQQAQTQRLLASARHFEALVASSDDAIVSKTLDGTVLSWNPAAERLFGLSAEQMVGQSILRLFPPDRLEEEDRLLASVRSGRRVSHFETVRLHSEGSTIPVAITLSPIHGLAGEVVGVSKIVRDISDRIRSEKEIWVHANFDALTGLPNRRMLRARGEQAIAEAGRRGEQVALVYIDIDFFKSVNDELGHAAGDELLVEFARRLKLAVREEDIVARLGGDEFVVLLAMDQGLGLVDTIVTRMQRQMADPFVIEGQSLKLTLSAGISLFPVDSSNWIEMLGHADKALYEAKGAGRHRVHYFTAEMERKARHRRQLLGELQQALAGDGLELHFQPVVRMSDGVMVKAEALLRWPHRERGWVGPGEFIPLAEQSGLIHEIGDWVVRRACEQARRSVALWGPHFAIAFNLSPAQLRQQPQLLERWRRVVGPHAWAAQHLVAEITEGVLVEQDAVTQDNLQAIAHAGMGLAIDDFGTGYSSLNYLSQLNAQTLKIDQSFTRQVVSDAKTRILCEAIVAMAHKLGMTVVAEGIETRAAWCTLRDMGCDLAQGYLIARALPPAEFEAFTFDLEQMGAS